MCSSLCTIYCLLSTVYCTGLAEEQDIKELNQALAHIKESYYGAVDVDSLAGLSLQAVVDSLDKDSRVVEGRIPSLDFVRGIGVEASIAKAGLISPGVGYVKISFFGRRTGLHFQEALETVGAVPGTEPGIKGLLLDLRDNPGGNLRSALQLLRLFVPPGKTLLIEKTKGGEKACLSEGGAVVPLPVVILINGSTASSAEMVAGALRYHCGAKIVGERSKGKGTIQEVIPLGTRTLILTVGEYLLPDGSCLKDKGILPDLEVKGDGEQFQAALSLLRP
jgi:carboxyl-terminal processing protease